MPAIDLSILNQRQTPAFYASSLATRPAASFAGRIFIDTDSPSTGLYRDTGTAWIQIADQGAGTTGTLQQVTTNGNTTTQGITITAGGLSSNLVTVDANALSSSTNGIIQGMANTDFWKIYGFATTADQGEMIFQVGDNGSAYASGGERFRFNYDNTGGGTAKDVFIVDYDLSYFNTSLGINTNTPGAALDVHSAVSGIAQLNQTVATNNSTLNFQNSNVGLWRIGSFYNAGANDFGIFDVVGSAQPVTVKKTTGQTFIGAETTSSGLLVVNSSTSDNHIVILGANGPSLRIRNAGVGPTINVGLGASTSANNFIQGSVNGDFCIFSANTTPSPILFGIYNAGIANVKEYARFSSAGNFLVNSTTDTGQNLQINGTSLFSGNVSISNTATGGLIITNNNNSHINLFRSNSPTSNFGINLNGNGDFNIDETGVATALTIKKTTQNILINTSTDLGYKLSVNGTGYFITTSTNPALLISLPANANANILSSFGGSSAFGWKIEQDEAVTGDWSIVRRQANVDYSVIKLSRGTGAATFAGSIAINNTVTASVLNTVTNKVSIVIGGVQYYLLASTSAV